MYKATDNQNLAASCLNPPPLQIVLFLNPEWSPRASDQAALALAKSTMALCNNVVTNFRRFCGSNNAPFSPNMKNSDIFADLICHVADSFTGPESLLRTSSATSGYLHWALGRQRPLKTAELAAVYVKNLIRVARGCRQREQGRCHVSPFRISSAVGQRTESCPVKQLRLEAVTLLAL